MVIENKFMCALYEMMFLVLKLYMTNFKQILMND